MKTYQITTIIAALILLLSSCQEPTEYSREIQQLDSLKIELNAVKGSIEEFDLEKIMMIDSVTQIHAATLNAGIQDTLSKDEWILLGAYVRAISKRLGEFDKKLNKLQNEVDTSLKQIEDLSADLAHNAIEKEKAIEYFKAERQKAGEISIAAAHMKKMASKGLETYYEDHEKVDSLMERISLRMQDTIDQ